MRGWGGERRGSQLTRDQFAHPETTGARPDTLNTQSIAVNPGVNRCQPPVTRLSTQLTDDQTRPYLDSTPHQLQSLPCYKMNLKKKSYFVAPSSQIDSLFILTPINFILTSNPIKITDYNWRLIPFNTIVDYLHDTFQFQLPEGQLGIFLLGANISSSKYSMFVDNGALLWDFCRRYVE